MIFFEYFCILVDKMKRFVSIVLAILVSVALQAQIRPGSVLDDLDDSETVSALKEHVRTLSAASMEGRP